MFLRSFWLHPLRPEFYGASAIGCRLSVFLARRIALRVRGDIVHKGSLVMWKTFEMGYYTCSLSLALSPSTAVGRSPLQC